MANVLIIDDSDAARLTLVALLEDAGFKVVEAVSLAEARARLADAGPLQLVLLDLGLPDGRGTELLPDIALTQPRARVAVLSGEAHQAVPGVEHVLEKSGAPDALIARITAILNPEVAA